MLGRAAAPLVPAPIREGRTQLRKCSGSFAITPLLHAMPKLRIVRVLDRSSDFRVGTLLSLGLDSGITRHGLPVQGVVRFAQHPLQQVVTTVLRDNDGDSENS